MITRDPGAFLDHARGCAPDFGPATARGAFLVAPDGFGRATQSATDNRYMAADAAAFDAGRALAQHRALQRALSTVVPTVCFRDWKMRLTGCSPTTSTRLRAGAC